MSELMFKIKLILLSLFILIMHNSYAIEGKNLESHSKAIKTLRLKILKAENNLSKNDAFAMGSLLTWLFASYKLFNARRARDDWFQWPMDLYIGGYYAVTILLYRSIKADNDYHEKKLAFLQEELQAMLVKAENSRDSLIPE